MELLHYRNDDWVFLCQVCYFFADRISKMATTGELSLPLDPMGISLKNLLNKLNILHYMNVPWMVLHVHLIYYVGADQKSNMAAATANNVF
jgi:hypothetical protein